MESFSHLGQEDAVRLKRLLVRWLGFELTCYRTKCECDDLIWFFDVESKKY